MRPPPTRRMALGNRGRYIQMPAALAAQIDDAVLAPGSPERGSGTVWVSAILQSQVTVLPRRLSEITWPGGVATFYMNLVVSSSFRVRMVGIGYAAVSSAFLPRSSETRRRRSKTTTRCAERWRFGLNRFGGIVASGPGSDLAAQTAATWRRHTRHALDWRRQHHSLKASEPRCRESFIATAPRRRYAGHASAGPSEIVCQYT